MRVGNRVGSYVTNMDFSQGIRANLNAPFRIIYSAEARKKIRVVLDDFQPDVVHLNNIQYHLTPSIILMSICVLMLMQLRLRNFVFVGDNFYSWTLWYLNGLIFALLLIDILLYIYFGYDISE